MIIACRNLMQHKHVMNMYHIVGPFRNVHAVRCFYTMLCNGPNPPSSAKTYTLPENSSISCLIVYNSRLFMLPS